MSVYRAYGCSVITVCTVGSAPQTSTPRLASGIRQWPGIKFQSRVLPPSSPPPLSLSLSILPSSIPIPPHPLTPSPLQSPTQNHHSPFDLLPLSLPPPPHPPPTPFPPIPQSPSTQLRFSRSLFSRRFHTASRKERKKENEGKSLEKKKSNAGSSRSDWGESEAAAGPSSVYLTRLICFPSSLSPWLFD